MLVWLTVKLPFNSQVGFRVKRLDSESLRGTLRALTLKMTSAQVVETSVTSNSSFHNYPHPDYHTIRSTDTPGFKPFTNFFSCWEFEDIIICPGLFEGWITLHRINLNHYPSNSVVCFVNTYPLDSDLSSG